MNTATPSNTMTIDPADLRLELSAYTHPAPGEPDDALTHWFAHLDLHHWAEDIDEHPVPTVIRVATVELFTFNPFDLPHGVMDCLDAHSADLATYMVMFDGDGDFDTELSDEYDLINAGVVILDRVTVEPAWRGRRLGPLAAAAAIRQLAGGAGIVACYPAPFETPIEDPARKAEQERVERIWRAFGFEEWREGIWLLDTVSTTLEDTFEELLADACATPASSGDETPPAQHTTDADAGDADGEAATVIPLRRSARGTKGTT